MSVLDSFLKVCFMLLAEGMLSKNGLIWRCNVKANNVFACSWQKYQLLKNRELFLVNVYGKTSLCVSMCVQSIQYRMCTLGCVGT